WAGYTSRKSLASSTMIWTGLGLLVFIVVHVAQIKYGAWYQIGDPPMRDLYRTEVQVFASPIWVAVYVVAIGIVGFHLRHGVASARQWLGLNQPVYTNHLVARGSIIAILIAAGFAVIPIWVYLTR